MPPATARNRGEGVAPAPRKRATTRRAGAQTDDDIVNAVCIKYGKSEVPVTATYVKKGFRVGWTRAVRIAAKVNERLDATFPAGKKRKTTSTKKAAKTGAAGKKKGNKVVSGTPETRKKRRVQPGQGAGGKGAAKDLTASSTPTPPREEPNLNFVSSSFGSLVKPVPLKFSHSNGDDLQLHLLHSENSTPKVHDGNSVQQLRLFPRIKRIDTASRMAQLLPVSPMMSPLAARNVQAVEFDTMPVFSLGETPVSELSSMWPGLD